MANSECKQIEKHIKDILFNGQLPEQPIGPPPARIQNHNSPFSIDDRCLLSNIENLPSQNAPVLPLAMGKSELIDFNVLTNFAAQHIDISPFPSPIDSKSFLPHPENDSPGEGLRRNGEIASLLGSMAQPPPPLIGNLVSRPTSSPVSQAIGTPKKATKKTLGSAKKPSGEEEKKAAAPTRKNKAQVKQMKKKERMDGLYLRKESKEREAKDEGSKEGGNKRGFNDVKAIAKRPLVEVEESFIKMKKDPLSELNVEYHLFMQEKQYKFQCSLCSYNTEVKESIIKHMNSKNHSSMKSQGDLNMMLPFLPPPMVQQTEAIAGLISKTVEKKGLNEGHLTKRNELCLKLQEFVKQSLPICSVELMGSSATGCGLSDAEVDFVLKVSSDDNVPDCLEKIFLSLKAKEEDYYKVIDDFQKKRPCIKFTDSSTYLPCNIHIDGSSSVKLANLLAAYLKLDRRVMKLGITLRYWANLCEIDVQQNGTLPSFCFLLMLIHFLQQVQPPVLPILHENKDYASVPEFYEEYLKSNQWKSQNTESLGELWLKFFHFYNFEYKLGEHVVCIRTSKRVTCKERNWATRFYAIEDPFLRRNLAYVIPSFQVCNYIEQCFLRTYQYFAYPQLRNESVKLMKTDSFDALKVSEYMANKPAPKTENSDQSDNSDSEDSDSADLEDHDPDIPLDSFVATVSNLSLKEPSGEQSSNKTVPEGTSTPNKNTEKTTKDKPCVKSSAPLCYWDVKGMEIYKESFVYEFKAVTFKGDKPFPLICKSCKASGHRKSDCPVDTLPTPVKLLKMTPDFLKTITNVLYAIRDKFLVSKTELDYIDKDMQKIQACIREVFPDATLKLFGSFCNGFGFKNQSDMDFCLTFGDRNDGKDLDSVEVIKKVGKELCGNPELVNVQAITSAKVPIVKFEWRRSKGPVEGDISLYNTLALANTELLELYSKIDPRVQVLGYGFKHFAKLLGICDASRGSLSSYAYILMVIFFLQQRNPPVIPVLQELYTDEKPVRLIDNCNVWFYKDIKNLSKVWPEFGKNKEGVGELWLGLLNFYTCDFNWKEFVVSIKQKSPLKRFNKQWYNTQLAIEDPFDLNHNLGGGLSRKMNTYIMKSFIRARERFGTPTTNIDKQKPESEQAYLFNRNFLNSGSEPPQDRGCSNCGKIGHIAKNCPQEKACSHCRQPGHLVKNCPKKGRGKKNNKERERNFSFEKPSTERRNSNDKPSNPRGNIQSQNSNKIDYSLQRIYPGMQQIPNPIEAQKMLQMGVPTHRLPPPGFNQNRNQPPPPGFNGFQGNYPRPFNAPFAPPFPPCNKEMLTQSPPKHYVGSPPRNYAPPPPGSFPPFHSFPGMPIRPGMERPPMRWPHGGGGRSQWQQQGRGHHPNNSGNPDYRLHRSNSDNSSNHDGW